MFKTFHVALREFIATVGTKGFIIGVILPPVLMGVVLTIMPLLLREAAPKVEGHVAIIDRSGQATESFQKYMSPDAVRGEMRDQLGRDGGPLVDSKQAEQGMKMAENMVLGSAQVSVRVLPPDADDAAERAQILTGEGKPESPDQRLALVVIPKESVTPAEGENPAELQILHQPKLAVQWVGIIQNAARRAVVDARLAANGLDAAKIRGLMAAPRTDTKSVTEKGDVKTSEALKMLLPGAFMFLLWIAVFTSGQYLLTSTIEEKSSRVMEVILSAVSPMQVLVGKILGQAAVGLLLLGFYAGAGLIGLSAFNRMSLIDPLNLIYLGIYFIIAFGSIACLFAAIGSAVSDVREAQSLLGPLMIVLVIPMMLWFPIIQNPNSVFAQVCSFIPPISPFIMVLRISGTEPVPFWQIPATIALGMVMVVVFAWAAAKIFRIGILMYGKPPNFITLVKWIRMA
jgi:ABC-2 type transport system permease protein